MTLQSSLKLIFILFTLPGFFNSLYGQKDSTKLNQEVEVVKAYRPSVAKAEKISLLPVVGDTTRFRPDLNYKTISHPITTGFQSSLLKANNLYPREINFPGYGKISGGFGTNLTPFADLYLNNPNAQNGTLGLQMNHLSSQGKVKMKGGDEVDAPFSYNRATLFGSYVLNGVTISSELTYQRAKNRFYGYPEVIPANILTNNFVRYFNQDQLQQSGFFDLSVKSNATSTADLKFKTNLNLSYFNTSTNQVEKASMVSGDFSHPFGILEGKLTAGFEHFETENVTDFPDLMVLTAPKSSWLHLAPTIFFENEYLALEGGVDLFAVSDNFSGNSFKPYPKLALSLFTNSKNITVYAALDGKLQSNNYSKIASENRFINPKQMVSPTSERMILTGGLKGIIAPPIAFNIGIKYKQIDDQYFYVTRIVNGSGKVSPTLLDLTYNNAFEVVYDNLTSLDFSGELSYTAANFFLLMTGHFYNYTLNTLEKAPYLPDFTLNATSSMKVSGKISALAEIYVTGPRNIQLKYYLPLTSSALPTPPIYLKIDPMITVNLGAKYQFIKNLEFTANIENLLNRKDEQWYGYTVQGLCLKLGASFSF